MRVEAVNEVTPQVHAALARLLPQLNPNLHVPDMERLQRLLADPAVTLLVAQEGDTIVGTTTVVVYTTSSGSRLDWTRSWSTIRREARAWAKRSSRLPCRSAGTAVPRSPSSSPGTARRARPPTASMRGWFQDPRDGRLQDRVGVV